jgi:hypothetical protein
MIAAAVALIALGVLFLFIFPWGGIVAGVVGVLLLVAALAGIGRRVAPPDRAE